MDAYGLDSFTVGAGVKAFHPGMLGVVRQGTVVKVGRKWLHIDFGPLYGGVFRTAPRDVVEFIGTADTFRAV